MKKDLLKATRVVPCSVVLLTAGTKDKKDVMTASAMFVAENLPLLTVSLSKSSTCHEIIAETGECCLNVASVDQVHLARQLGAVHGRKVDKFRKFNISVQEPSAIKSPRIGGSFANLECAVITSHQAGNYIVYIVEVVAFSLDEKLIPLAWCGDHYYALDKKVH